MQRYEYKVVPAPARGEKARGLKTGEERFAHTMAELLNRMAVKGWEFQRAETLPAEERTGLTGRSTVYHNLLVFRRPTAPEATSGATAVTAVATPEAAEPADAANDEAAPLTAGTGAAATFGAASISAVERRAQSLSSTAPEGRSPRLGPARGDRDSDQGPRDQDDYEE